MILIVLNICHEISDIVKISPVNSFKYITRKNKFKHITYRLHWNIRIVSFLIEIENINLKLTQMYYNKFSLQISLSSTPFLFI